MLGCFLKIYIKNKNLYIFYKYAHVCLYSYFVDVIFIKLLLFINYYFIN